MARTRARAAASHILVDNEALALELREQILAGADFGELARQHSSCPSGQKEGSLGQFGQGDMVPEFDDVVFSTIEIGEVSEPVETEFGYHLIRVDRRVR